MVTDWDDAVGALKAVTITLEPDLPIADIENIWEFIGVGELVLALETLCTQLYEYEVDAGNQPLLILAELGKYFGLKPDLWNRLKPLPRSG